MRVVPTLDPLEHSHLGFGLAPEAPAIEQFAFQRGEAALGHGVVVSISHGSHGRHDTGFSTALDERVTGVHELRVRQTLPGSWNHALGAATLLARLKLRVER
jgi:hypothetical protein